MINLNFSHWERDFGHLIPGIKISSQGSCSPFVFVFLLYFLTPTSLKEGHFSQQLLEPGNIEIVHKHPNSVIY